MATFLSSMVLAPPVQGWVASACILSCAPLLVRGERATQWRGGIAEGTPGASSRKPAARSRKSALRPCPPLSKGGWRAPIYSLAPHCLSGGRGPRSGEGGLPKARREPAAGSRQPEAGSRHYALAPPVQGWVASAYILSCAPLLVRGERATQWRGGIAEGTPEADSRQPAARSR